MPLETPKRVWTKKLKGQREDIGRRSSGSSYLSVRARMRYGLIELTVERPTSPLGVFQPHSRACGLHLQETC